MPAQKFYEGQEFHNPSDPSAPVLVYRGGKFLPKDASGHVANSAALTNKDQEFVSHQQENANNIETLAGNTKDFMNANERTPTGGILALPFATRVAKGLGMKGSEDLGAMDRDNIASAVQMRAPGMRMTQMEFQKFLGATPAAQNSGPVNQRIATDIYRGNALAQAKAAFYTTYLSHKRNLDGAGPAWLSFKQQHFNDDGDFSHDPLSDKDASNQAVRALSAKSGQPAPVTHGMTVDVFGRPVDQ